jgi:hypothetical protein
MRLNDEQQICTCGNSDIDYVPVNASDDGWCDWQYRCMSCGRIYEDYTLDTAGTLADISKICTYNEKKHLFWKQYIEIPEWDSLDKKEREKRMKQFDKIVA